VSDRSRQRLAAEVRATLRGWAARVRAVLSPDAELTGAHEREQASAEEMARAAAELKGGMAKLAQLTAYLPGDGAARDADARRALGRLWDRAPAVSADAVRQVIVDDLGASPNEVFARFDPEPFAAASLGQVHAAAHRDGTALAVKVQYPGVAEALADDLASPGLARRLAGAGVGRALDEEALSALREALLAELDYQAEGRWMSRFAAAYRADQQIVIPSWHEKLSSRRVLTMDRLTGTPLTAVSSDAQHDAAALTIFRFTWGAPLLHGLLNADPNPGNYVILDAQAGRVGFLDFGCAVTLDPALVAGERKLWRTLYERDQFGLGGEPFRHALYQQGLVKKLRTLDSDTYREWERYVTYPFRQTEPFEWTADYAARMGDAFSKLVQAGAFALPAPTLLLWRQRLGVAAVIAALRPRADFRAALRALLDLPASPTGS
jgi:predicted unusual protein kinase regulating ubiquinone biosynthesis (AarF/ABC1/UbiB family)